MALGQRRARPGLRPELGVSAGARARDRDRAKCTARVRVRERERARNSLRRRGKVGFRERLSPLRS